MRWNWYKIIKPSRFGQDEKLKLTVQFFSWPNWTVLKGNLTFFFYGFSETLTVYLRFHDFLVVHKLKLKLVSLKPRVSTEEEAGWFHWNQGFRLRRRLCGFIETKSFDWEEARLRRGQRPPSQSNTLGFNENHPTSFSVECPWFKWNPPSLLLSRIPLI